jgi:hypothetical protein
MSAPVGDGAGVGTDAPFPWATVIVGVVSAICTVLVAIVGAPDKAAATAPGPPTNTTTVVTSTATTSSTVPAAAIVVDCMQQRSQAAAVFQQYRARNHFPENSPVQIQCSINEFMDSLS